MSIFGYTTPAPSRTPLDRGPLAYHGVVGFPTLLCREPGFGVTNINFEIASLLGMAKQSTP